MIDISNAEQLSNDQIKQLKSMVESEKDGTVFRACGNRLDGEIRSISDLHERVRTSYMSAVHDFRGRYVELVKMEEFGFHEMKTGIYVHVPLFKHKYLAGYLVSALACLDDGLVHRLLHHIVIDVSDVEDVAGGLLVRGVFTARAFSMDSGIEKDVMADDLIRMIEDLEK